MQSEMSLRQAAQQALKEMDDHMYRADTHEFYEAKEALRAALAEPETFMHEYKHQTYGYYKEDGVLKLGTMQEPSMVVASECAERACMAHDDRVDGPGVVLQSPWIPLYAAPTPRKPVELTDEELEKAFNANGWSNHICGLRDVIAAYEAKQRGKE